MDDLVPVPEPKAVLGGMVLLVPTAWREQKRRIGRLGNS